MSGQVIAVRSVSSGAGKTVVAGNLAFELAASGNRVLLADLDATWPSLHRYFNLPQQQASVLAALRLIEKQQLNSQTLEDLSIRLVARGVGIAFLSGFSLDLNRATISANALESFIARVAALFDYVVLDCESGTTSTLVKVISEQATRQVVVTQVDAISLGRFVDSQSELEPQLLQSQPVLVLNRMRSSVLGARPEWQVQQVLRDRTRFSSATILPDDSIFDHALMKGLPLRQLGGKSKALQAIGELAARLQ